MPAEPETRAGALARVGSAAERTPFARASGPRLRRRMAALAFAVCAGSCATRAHASDYDDALRAGVSARDRARESQFVSDWQDAFEEFQRAVELHDTAAARFELAEAAAALGRVELAYESHELALASGLPAKAEAIARAYLDAHAADVARLEVDAPAGTSVSVDGRERGRVPLARPMVVPAGSVTIRLTAPDATIWEETLDLEPRVARRISLRRAPSPSVSPTTSALASSAPPRTTGSAEAPPAEPSWLGSRPAAIALLSVAGVSLVAGGWFAYKAYDSKQDAADTRSQILAALEGHVENNVVAVDAVPCGNAGIASGAPSFASGVPELTQQSLIDQYANACDELVKRQARTERYTTAATIGFGVGLAASAGLLTWYLVSPSEDTPHDEPPRVALAPILSRDTQGLWVELAF